MIVFSLISGIFLSNAGYANEQVVLQLKWLHQFQFAGYYAAKEKGFYEEAGFDVIIKERDLSLTPAEAVLAKKADYGVIGSSIILDRMKGRPLVALGAVFQHSPLVLITLSENKYLGPYELIDKKVMYRKGSDDATFIAMFHQLGISENDFIHVPHSFNSDSLIHGEVDAISAYLTDQPFYFQEKGIDIQVINPINYGIDFYDDILFTSEENVRNNPEKTQSFLKASMKGWQYALKNKAEVISWFDTKYPSKKSLESLHFEAEQTEKMILPNLVDIGHISKSRFQRIADIYKQRGLVSNLASFEGVVFRDYLTKQNSLPVWAKIAFAFAIACFVGTLALFGLNRRLKRMVSARAEELNIVQDNLERYVDILDRYVISSRTNLDGVIVETSSAFCAVSGYSKKELIGQSHGIVRHPDTPDSLYQNLWGTITKGESWTGEIKNKAKDGTSYWVDAKIDPVKDENNEICGYISIREDITDKKHIEALSITDSLTGLKNRLKLDQVLLEELNRVNRYSLDLSLIICDIDFFKKVNDNYGHLIGDQVLVAISKIFCQNCREVDVVGRWGGEEFLIICRETTIEGALSLAEKLRAIIDDHIFPGVGHITASFGITAVLPKDSTQAALQRADKALYHAKEHGRNRVEYVLSGKSPT